MIVAARFNGPPTSGNGGYTAGLLGTRITAPTVTVTLRKPPPLDTPYSVERTDGDGLAAYADGELIATAVAAAAKPTPPDWADPATAGEYPGFTEHPFPTCYVCGPRRDDGLAIFPGTLPGDKGTAAGWRVPADVDAVTVWAALDCPGGWAIISLGGPPVGASAVIADGLPSARNRSRPYVLGRITVAIEGIPTPGEQCVVVGECTGVEGRKGFVRSGLFAPDHRLLAAAEAVWIAV